MTFSKCQFIETITEIYFTDQLSLSVNYNGTVNHYRVRKRRFNESMDEGFCITSRKMFVNLPELVDFYSKEANGLCCKLSRSCPRPPPVISDLSRNTRDRWEINRNSIELLRKLGSGNFGEVYQGKTILQFTLFSHKPQTNVIKLTKQAHGNFTVICTW